MSVTNGTFLRNDIIFLIIKEQYVTKLIHAHHVIHKEVGYMQYYIFVVKRVICFVATAKLRFLPLVPPFQAYIVFEILGNTRQKR